GPLPAAPQKETTIRQVIDQPPNVPSLESKPARHGNRKKPDKKRNSLTSSTKELAEREIASPPPTVIPAPLPTPEKRAERAPERAPDFPVSASLFKVTQPIVPAATPAPSHSPATREIRP